jgi:hypothetical protein
MTEDDISPDRVVRIWNNRNRMAVGDVGSTLDFDNCVRRKNWGQQDKDKK